MRSNTARLPKGESYPLKPAKLEQALASANISIDVYLTRTPGNYFQAEFWPPNPRVPYERLYIQAGSVLSEVASNARSEMDGTALPALVNWIAGILARDPRSPVRRERQSLKFY
jgi:hypothetical protein